MELLSHDVIDISDPTITPTPETTTGMITIPDVAARLGVRDRYVRRLVAERRIPYYKVGYLIRFDPHEVEEWLTTSHIAQG
ncbi:MAG: helix-turn-helix domain-containing protein [Acidimicrobiales bacterium]